MILSSLTGCLGMLEVVQVDERVDEVDGTYRSEVVEVHLT
jgi:hypothetical protein